MNQEELLSSIQGKESELNRRLIIVYLSWILGRRYIKRLRNTSEE